MGGKAALLLPLLLLGPAGLSQSGPAAPKFVFPLSCRLGADCVIQNYKDADPTPAARDHKCGSRTYVDHDGTDFRLKTMAQQRRGVDVLAAAAGKVVGGRDGVPDLSVRVRGAAAVKGQECGNGVMIDHGGGWATQYCHMAKGSVTVKAGEPVAAGARLGKVGLSGNTEYPHLHFTVRQNGTAVDPFAYGAPPQSCGAGRSLWAPAAGLAYVASEILNAGFATGPVSMDEASEQGADQSPKPSRTAPALVAFVQSIGLKAGDVQKLSLRSPTGTILAENKAAPLPRDQAQSIVYAGKKRSAEGWPSGIYSARYTVQRKGKTAIDKSFILQLK